MMRLVPLAICMLTGGLLVATYFIPGLNAAGATAEEWFAIIAAIAFLLGGANLSLHHLKTISDRAAGWGYSAVTLLAFFATLGVGLLKWGVPPQAEYPTHAWSGDYLAEGSGLWWLYTYAMLPLTATMFSLLAFYVASAAYRAFRARNTEAMLLLGTALIVLLGRTYAGAWLTSGLPPSMETVTIPGLSVLIISVFNTSGQRAIMIGIAIGVAATSLRILLGMDRSYLGADGE